MDGWFDYCLIWFFWLGIMVLNYSTDKTLFACSRIYDFDFYEYID